MKKVLFTNETILSWLQYYADNSPIDLEQIKMMDITKRNKNLIPTVEENKAVLAFMEAGDAEIFYRMWQAGLGDCEVWYNEGATPEGPIKHDKVCDMINRGINESAAMLVVNDNARNTIKIGFDGNIRENKKVGAELRTVILSKLQISREDTVCIIGGESMAVEAAFQANEGTVIAIEYNHKERDTMADNRGFYDLRNMFIMDHIDEESMKKYPVPDTTFIAASASFEKELECLMKLNPNMNLVIYTLDFTLAGKIQETLLKYGITEPEIIQMSVQKLNSKNTFDVQPAPWIITAKADE